MFKKWCNFALMSTLVLGGLVACQPKTIEDTAPSATQQAILVNIPKVSMVVEGYEFGPAVSKLILEADTELSQVSATKKLNVHTATPTAASQRKVLQTYLSDERGHELSTGLPSRYITLDLQVTYDDQDAEKNVSPLAIDPATGRQEWVASYQVHIEGLKVKSDQGVASLTVDQDAIAHRLMLETDQFAYRGQTSGVYTNPLTTLAEEVVLQYAAFEPQRLAEGEQNPLLVWLHAGPESGTDPNIALLGNEVTGLVSGGVQSHFTSTGIGLQKGAYVLAVQAPTGWMDDGRGGFHPDVRVSRYTEALRATIADYVASRPDIDPQRIYLSGAGEGGAMTLVMGLAYPSDFAALVPIASTYPYYLNYVETETQGYAKAPSEAPLPSVLTEVELAALASQPIWWIHSQADTHILANDYVLPFYKHLLDQGLSNKWLSYYEDVRGLDMPKVTYPGHWAWSYYLNDKVLGVQSPSTVTAVADLSGFVPSTAKFGGEDRARVGDKVYENLFDWLNDQGLGQTLAVQPLEEAVPETSITE